jgi:UDP-N-acetylglucosamine 2-epimerase (non-hydrolysing)
MTTRTFVVVGTRPEAIKMAPLILCLEKDTRFSNQLCVTGQHHEMLDSMLQLFDLTPNFAFQAMTHNQNLGTLTARLLQYLTEVFSQNKPDIVLVQGDTTTAFVAALAAFYFKIPVGHVEAGLRTKNLYSPWPEEANRTLIGHLAHIHFAPTAVSRANLLKEGIPSAAIHVTGNTVIDALYTVIQKIDASVALQLELRQRFKILEAHRPFILVTGHRRENFGNGFEQICCALAQIAQSHPEVDIIYPVHLNPNVQKPVMSLLGGIDNIKLIAPVDYVAFVYLMRSCYLILTDSGGVQEEAPSLGKPVLVLRENTERPEAVEAGTVELVGTDVSRIVASVEKLLTNKVYYQKMSEAINPYGDGASAQRIVEALAQLFISQGAVHA